MTRFLKRLFLFISFSLLFTVLYKACSLDTGHNPTIRIGLDDLEHITDKNWALGIINTLNTRSYGVKNLSASNIKIRLKRVLAKGSLYYEDGNLRFMAASIFGKELDIGSNNELFWFWSKRIKPQALYFSFHTENCSDRLKPVFSKDWLVCCFMFNVVSPHKDIEFYKKDDYLVTKCAINRGLNYIVTLIDYKQLTIKSRLLYNLDGSVVAVVNYDQFDELFIPRLVEMYWYEEGMAMNWEIKEVEVNKRIEDVLWRLPDYEPKINICSD